MRKIKVRVGHVGASLRLSEVSWSVMACLFAESAREFQRAVDEFQSECWEEEGDGL